MLSTSAACRRPPVWTQTPLVSTLLEAWRELGLPSLGWAHATWVLALLLLMGFVNLAVTFPEGPPHAAHQLSLLVTLQVRRTQNSFASRQCCGQGLRPKGGLSCPLWLRALRHAERLGCGVVIGSIISEEIDVAG
jgi:hypothetical protein